MCRRHLKLEEKNQRIQAYIDADAPRCTNHPSTRPKVTYWFSPTEPRLFCPTGIGTPTVSTASGKGKFRITPKSTYTEWCPWQHVVPNHIVAGLHRKH